MKQLERKGYRNFLWKYYGISAFYEGVLFVLHYTALIIAELFSPMAVTTLFVTANVTQVLLEVPTGSWADRFGRKRVLIIGQLLCTLGFVAISINHSFGAFLLFEVLYGTQSALFSGALEALVYDNLKYYQIDRSFPEYRCNAESLTLVGFAGSALLSGVIVKWYGYEPLYWLQVLSAGVTLCLLCSIQDRGAEDPNIRKLNNNYWKILASSIKYVRKNLSALKSLLFGAAYWSIWIIFLIFQPLLFAELLHNERVELVGIMIALQCVLTALGKTGLMRYAQGKSLYTAMGLFIISAGSIVGCFYIYRLPMAFVLWLLFWIFSYVPYAMASNIEHALIPSRLRATILSLKGFMISLIKSGYLLVFGILGDLYSYRTSFWVMGWIYALIISGFYFLVLRDRHIRHKQVCLGYLRE